MQRLIDANKLKPEIDKFIGYLDEDMIYRIKVVIDRAETVDRHKGHWVRVENPRYEYDRENGDINAGVSYHCSECNNIGWYSDKFCKECGSEMKNL